MLVCVRPAFCFHCAWVPSLFLGILDFIVVQACYWRPDWSECVSGIRLEPNHEFDFPENCSRVGDQVEMFIVCRSGRENLTGTAFDRFVKKSQIRFSRNFGFRQLAKAAKLNKSVCWKSSAPIPAINLICAAVEAEAKIKNRQFPVGSTCLSHCLACRKEAFGMFSAGNLERASNNGASHVKLESHYRAFLLL